MHYFCSCHGRERLNSAIVWTAEEGWSPAAGFAQCTTTSPHSGEQQTVTTSELGTISKSWSPVEISNQLTASKTLLVRKQETAVNNQVGGTGKYRRLEQHPRAVEGMTTLTLRCSNQSIICILPSGVITRHVILFQILYSILL